MTTPQQEPEMTVDDVVKFVRSPYFTAAFRVSVLVFGSLSTVGVGVVTWAVFDTRVKADTAVLVASEVQGKLEARTKDNDLFQTNVIGKVEDVHDDLNVIRRDQLGVAQAVGRIEGVLEQLQERVGVASWRAAN